MTDKRCHVIEGGFLDRRGRPRRIDIPERVGGVARFPANRTGRDFLVGDLHGAAGDLILLLTGVRFDPSRDRLFCAGDLVNKGEGSVEVLELASQPWFHAVMGNHDLALVKAFRAILHASKADRGLVMPEEARMLIEEYRMGWLTGAIRGALSFQRGHGATIGDLTDWIVNTVQQNPLMIEIDTPGGQRVGLIHGDPALDMSGHPSWSATRYAISRLPLGSPDVFEFESSAAAMSCVCGRNVLGLLVRVWGGATRHDRHELACEVRGIERVYSGHSPVGSHPFRVGNRVWIDSGSSLGLGEMFLLDLHADLEPKSRNEVQNDDLARPSRDGSVFHGQSRSDEPVSPLRRAV